jgi:hypothetical protein
VRRGAREGQDVAERKNAMRTAHRLEVVSGGRGWALLLGQEDRRWPGARRVGQNFRTPPSGFAAATGVTVFS